MSRRTIRVRAQPDDHAGDPARRRAAPLGGARTRSSAHTRPGGGGRAVDDGRLHALRVKTGPAGAALPARLPTLGGTAQQRRLRWSRPAGAAGVRPGLPRVRARQRRALRPHVRARDPRLRRVRRQPPRMTRALRSARRAVRRPAAAPLAALAPFQMVATRLADWRPDLTDPAADAHLIWATMHGLVTIELMHRRWGGPLVAHLQGDPEKTTPRPSARSSKRSTAAR